MTTVGRRLGGASAAALFASLGMAQAAESGDAQRAGAAAAVQQTAPQPMDLARWMQAQQELRGALSAQQLMAVEVRGREGEQLGSIEEILIDERGRATAVGIGVGGVLGVAQNHLRVPWDALELSPDRRVLHAPVARDNVDRFAFFDRTERRAGEYRVTELLRSQARLTDGARYGPVNDLIFAHDGRVAAMIVSAGGVFARGQYALPFSPQALRTGDRDTLATGVRRAQLAQLRPFDYQAMDIGPHVTGRVGTGIGGMREGATGAAPALQPGRAGLAQQAAAAHPPAGESARIGTFDLRQLHGALSAERLKGLDVRGRGDERLGSIDDLVLSAAGRVVAAGIGVGGVAGLAQNVVRVPWEQVKFGPGMAYAVVPLSADEAGRFGLFDRVELHPGERRASDLMRGHVETRGGDRYGGINDLVIDRQGRLQAVVADAGLFAGMRAVPFRPEGLQPDENVYRAAHDRAEIDRLRPFDYVGLEIGPRAGADARVGIGVGGTTDGAAGGRVGPAGAQRTH